MIVGHVDIRVEDPHHHLAITAATQLLALALEHEGDEGDDGDDTEPRAPLGFTASLELDPARHDLVLGEPMWDE